MQISSKQILWLMVTMQVSMTLLLTIQPTIMTALQDAWISALIACLYGAGLSYCIFQICSAFPNQSLVEFLPKLVGKWFGYVLIAVYGLYWYVVLVIILSQYADFITSTILIQTPYLVPIIAMMLVVIYVCDQGIEVLARCCQLLGPFLLLGLVATLLLSIPEMHILNVLPIYSDTGLKQIMQGALPISTFQGDSIILFMLLGFVTKLRQGKAPVVLGAALSGFVTALATFCIITVFGWQVSSSQTYPYFNMVRNISIYNFFQNMDSVIITVWIIGVFIKVSLYFFVCTFGTAQVFKIKNWRRLIWILAPVIVALTLIPHNYYNNSIVFPQKIAMPILLPLQSTGLPLLLWIIVAIKKKSRASQVSS